MLLRESRQEPESRGYSRAQGGRLLTGLLPLLAQLAV